MATTTKRAPRTRKAPTRKVTARAPHVDATVEVRTKTAAKSAATLDPRTLVFASVGAGDLVYSAVRDMSGKVVTIARAPHEAQDLAEKLSEDVLKAVEGLAARGEKLVGSIRGSAYTSRAAHQTKVARSQVKAATTSVRKAVDTTTAAAREAVKKVS
jgi:hypothetical protein